MLTEEVPKTHWETDAMWQSVVRQGAAGIGVFWPGTAEQGLARSGLAIQGMEFEYTKDLGSARFGDAGQCAA